MLNGSLMRILIKIADVTKRKSDAEADDWRKAWRRDERLD
jgi:hypothetical protein